MLNLQANAIYTPHLGQAGGAGQSPRLWANSYGQELTPDGFANAFGLGDEFLAAGKAAANLYVSEAGLYASYEDAGAAISQLGAEAGGVLRMSLPATANSEVWLISGANTGALGDLNGTEGSSKLTIFEARIRPSQVASGGFFVGLAEVGSAAADFISDAGALVSKSFLGFYVAKAAPTVLTFVYGKNGQAVQTPIASLATLTANAWRKVGFVLNPRANASQRLKIVLDNIEQDTTVSAATMVSSLFPNGDKLAFLAGAKNAANTMSLDLDWWNFFQSR